MSSTIIRSQLTLWGCAFVIATSLTGCGGSSNDGTPSPSVLFAGSTVTIATNAKIKVPKGTSIKSPSGNTLWVFGNETEINVPVGSVLTAPADATDSPYTVTANPAAATSLNTTIDLIAGSATGLGAADGQGAAATFAGAGNNMAIDSAGNIIAEDQRLLRKVTQSGDVTTLAYNHGDFVFNPAVAVDNAGNIFVSGIGVSYSATTTAYYRSDVPPSMSYSQDIYVRTVSGESPVFKGLVQESSTPIYQADLAIDSSNNLYTSVNNSTNANDGTKIVKIDRLGQSSVFLNRTLDPSQDANSQLPTMTAGLAFDAQDNLYTEVVGSGSTAFRKITPKGVVTSLTVPRFEPITTVDVVGRLIPAVNASTFKFAVDGTGNIYYPYTNNDYVNSTTSIMRLDTAGNLTQYPVASGLKIAGGITADKSGHVYLNIVSYKTEGDGLGHGSGTAIGSQIYKISFPK